MKPERLVALCVFGLFVCVHADAGNHQSSHHHSEQDDSDDIYGASDSNPRADASLEDEEFIGFADEPPTEKKQRVTAKPRPKPTGFRLRAQKHYYYEIGALFFLALFVINFFVGKNKNQRLADAWMIVYWKLLQEQFSLPSPTDESVWEKERQNEFTLYSTGRAHCTSMTTTLQLRKRHDLFSLLYELIAPAKDTLTFDVAMNDDDMESFVFAACNKRFEKHLKKQRNDLGLYAVAATCAVSDAPPNLSVLSEFPELADEVLSAEVVRTLAKKMHHFKYMHISDQDGAQLPPAEGSTAPVPSTPAPVKRVLRLQLFVPKAEHIGEIKDLVRLLFFLIDHLPNIRLSQPAKAKAEKARQLAQETYMKALHRERQEAAQRRKADKKRQEVELEESQVANLSREEKLKREAKAAKAEIKKRQPRVKLQRMG